MVTIINFEKRQSKSGKEFHALIIQGGIEMVRSAETGQFYATVKRCSIASTLDEDSCKAMIGEKLDGKIEKVSCDPYEYVVQETGEVIELSHRWSYVPNSQSVSMSSFFIIISDSIFWSCIASAMLSFRLTAANIS